MWYQVIPPESLVGFLIRLVLRPLGADAIGLYQHLGGRATADALDDLVVLLVGTEDVEDHEVRVERVDIVLGRADQHLGGEAADGAVLDLQVGVREAMPQIVGDLLAPLLLGDRLAVEHDSHVLAVLRRAGGQERHRPLNASAQRRRVAHGLGRRKLAEARRWIWRRRGQ